MYNLFQPSLKSAISDSIVDYYMIDTQEAGRCVTSVENGSWKIIGKNKEAERNALTALTWQSVLRAKITSS